MTRSYIHVFAGLTSALFVSAAYAQLALPAGVLHLRFAEPAMKIGNLSDRRANTLAALIVRALRSHPSLAAAAGRINAAQSEIEAARWGYWPTPSVSYEQADRPVTKGTDEAASTVSLKQPLWTHGRLAAGVAGAEAGRTIAQAGREETRRDLALEVIRAYADGYAAQGRLAAYTQSLATHDRLLDQVRRRVDGGLSTESDIVLAQSRREAVRASQSQARAQFDQALASLEELVGQTLEATQGERFRSIGIPRQTPPSLANDEALASDPTLARLAAEADQLSAQVDGSRAALLPEVYARLDQRHGDVTGGNTRFVIALESRWGAGLSTASAVSASDHRRQAKQGDIDARRRELSRQLRADALSLANAQERSQTLQAAHDAALKVSMSWDRQFLAGKKSWQDVMNAAREAGDTEAQLADVHAAVLLYGWRLAVLTQGIEQVLANEERGLP